LTKAPFMLYAGQELGEQGMDTEGFSGLDGRTTIFDYWGVKSLQDWSNKGKFDGKLLSDEQKALRALYKKLLNLSLKEPAIAKGKMYDLQYANFNNPSYDTNRQFAYFRQYGKDLLLIVVNFASSSTDISINIPQGAFEYLVLALSSKVEMEDLMDQQYQLSTILSADNQVELTIPAHSGRILKIKNTQES